MNEPPGEDVILYWRDGVSAINVRLASDTVWLSLNQLVDLLGQTSPQFRGTSPMSSRKGNWNNLQLLQNLQQLPPTAKTTRSSNTIWMSSNHQQRKVMNRIDDLIAEHCPVGVENDYNLSTSFYVESRDTREVIDITALNAELKTTVTKIKQLRSDIGGIVAEIKEA